MTITEETIKAILNFRDQRDWKQFHNGKDLAISLSLEASELLELYQWSGTNLTVDGNKEKMKEELADILMYAILFADIYDFDLNKIISDKISKNNNKYPQELAKGRSEKYDKLREGN